MPATGGAGDNAGAARAAPDFLPPWLRQPPALPSALVLCLLVAVAYFPATLGGFVWDDAAFISVAPVQALSGLWQIWFEPTALIHEGHYWPLLYTTFWLEHKLWGFDSPAYFHIFNLLLHAGVVVLLWRLLLRLEVASAWTVWVAAAVFAAHPLHVESVAWIIGRKDVMATLFYLTSVLFYLRFMEDRRRGQYAWALASFVLGLLCKSIAVTLPVSLLLWHWWKRGRVTVADGVRVLPFLLLGLGIAVADWAYYKDREVIVLEDYSFIEQMLSAAQALWFYAGKLVWPTELAVIYPHWEVDIGNPLGWAYPAAAVAVAALLWAYRGSIGRGPLAGALFFAVTLAPTLGFVDYGYMQFSFVADRFQYLAGAGVIVLVVAAAGQGFERLAVFIRFAMPARTTLIAAVPPAAAALAVLAILGTLTWQQSGIYRDNRTFYSHIISLNPQARNAHYNLGNDSYKDRRFADALAAYRIAAEKRPGHVWAHLGMGLSSEALDRLDEAETHYQNALRIAPRLPKALNHLGALRLKQQRYPEALELFQTWRETAPDDADVHYAMGVSLANLNRPEEALQSFERALTLNPSLEEARENRDYVLEVLKRRGR